MVAFEIWHQSDPEVSCENVLMHKLGMNERGVSHPSPKEIPTYKPWLSAGSIHFGPIWRLVGGLNPSEKSIGMIIPNIWENKKWQPNHQPVEVFGIWRKGFMSPRSDSPPVRKPCSCLGFGRNPGGGTSFSHVFVGDPKVRIPGRHAKRFSDKSCCSTSYSSEFNITREMGELI